MVDYYAVTEKENQMILADIEILKPQYDDFILDVLVQFVDQTPEVKSIFSWGNPVLSGKQHLPLPGFQKHGKIIGGKLLQCLTQLDKMNKMEAQLKTLGDIHNMKNVQLQYYENLGTAILDHLPKRLPKGSWNKEKEAAWKKAYNLVISYMTGPQ